ncbi:unnamed protein product [Closterium sp. Yama58-4]|nr:unnamed protein product [Closterium sp. Yama58-4]
MSGERALADAERAIRRPAGASECGETEEAGNAAEEVEEAEGGRVAEEVGEAGKGGNAEAGGAAFEGGLSIEAGIGLDDSPTDASTDKRKPANLDTPSSTCPAAAADSPSADKDPFSAFDGGTSMSREPRVSTDPDAFPAGDVRPPPRPAASRVPSAPLSAGANLAPLPSPRISAGAFRPLPRPASSPHVPSKARGSALPSAGSDLALTSSPRISVGDFSHDIDRLSPRARRNRKRSPEERAEGAFAAEAPGSRAVLPPPRKRRRNPPEHCAFPFRAFVSVRGDSAHSSVVIVPSPSAHSSARRAGESSLHSLSMSFDEVALRLTTSAYGLRTEEGDGGSQGEVLSVIVGPTPPRYSLLESDSDVSSSANLDIILETMKG